MDGAHGACEAPQADAAMTTCDGTQTAAGDGAVLELVGGTASTDAAAVAATAAGAAESEDEGDEAPDSTTSATRAAGASTTHAPSRHYDPSYDVSHGLFTYTRPHNVIDNGAVSLRGLDAEEIAELERAVASGFYSPQLLRDVLAQLNDERSPLPRLRVFDWCVTNWAKAKAAVIVRGDGGMMDIWSEYNTVLDELHRKLFDPFRRRGNTMRDKKSGKTVERLDKRVYFAVPPTSAEVDAAAAAGVAPPPPLEEWTTVAQLVFVRWAVVTHVFEYVVTNHAAIAAHRFKARKARAGLNLNEEEEEDDAGGSGPRRTKKKGRGAAVGARRRCRELSSADTMMRGAVGGTMVLATADTVG